MFVSPVSPVSHTPFAATILPMQSNPAAIKFGQTPPLKARLSGSLLPYLPASVIIQHIIRNPVLASSNSHTILDWKTVDVDALNLLPPNTAVPFKTRDKATLVGTWVPAATASTTTVIMGHGYIANGSVFVPLVQALHQAGVNVFLFDFRAHGRSRRLGQWRSSIGLEREGYDILAAVETVKKRFSEQAKTLVYLGHSMGASAFLAAPHSLKREADALDLLKHQVDGIVLDSPFRDLAAAFRESKTLQQALNKRKMQQLAHQSFAPWLHPIRRPIGKLTPSLIFKNSPLYEKFTETGRWLHLHGDQDTTTPYQQALEISEDLKTPLGTLRGEDHQNEAWEIPGLPGKFRTVVRNEDYVKRIVDFVKRLAASSTD